MEQIEFYAYPTDRAENLELRIEMDIQNPLRVQPLDQEQLDKDWKERGYTRSSPVGTLFDAVFNAQTGETKLKYRLTEYKVYSGIAFPALPSTEGNLSLGLKEQMRVSACSCVVETADGKIVAQRRKEGLIAGGMIDPGAAGIMVYDPIAEKMDWRQSTLEKMARELKIQDFSQINLLAPQAVFSSRDQVRVPATKGYFTGCYSGMVGSLAKVSFSYDHISEIFDKQEVAEVIGINKSDLAAFIVEHAGKSNRGLTCDGCAALLSALPVQEFYQTMERINSKELVRIRLGHLQEGKFKEYSR